jgi:hypothetical protein
MFYLRCLSEGEFVELFRKTLDRLAANGSVFAGRRCRLFFLNNEMYIGRIVWNRQRFVKNPDTDKRMSRLNPREEWVIQDVPELRIIDQDLWDAVKVRQQTVNQNPETGEENGIWERRRARYLPSGLTRCGVCDAQIITVAVYWPLTADQHRMVRNQVEREANLRVRAPGRLGRARAA